MNRELWKRLEAAEHGSGIARMVVFMPEPGESAAEADARYERWKAGESMQGLPDYADIRNDPVVRVTRVTFVDPPKRSV